jgi:hypothetical protein
MRVQNSVEVKKRKRKKEELNTVSHQHLRGHGSKPLAQQAKHIQPTGQFQQRNVTPSVSIEIVMRDFPIITQAQ